MRICSTLLLLGALFVAAGCEGKLTVEIDGKGMVNVLGIEEPLNCTKPKCEYEISGGSELTLKAAPLGKGVFQSFERIAGCVQ